MESVARKYNLPKDLINKIDQHRRVIFMERVKQFEEIHDPFVAKVMNRLYHKLIFDVDHTDTNIKYAIIQLEGMDSKLIAQTFILNKFIRGKYQSTIECYTNMEYDRYIRYTVSRLFG